MERNESVDVKHTINWVKNIWFDSIFVRKSKDGIGKALKKPKQKQKERERKKN